MQNLAAATVLVTLVAIDAVVDVAIHALVILVGLRLLVTTRALEHRIVVRVGVTGGTHSIGAAMIGREVSVIKGCTSPGSGRVARLASGRETSGNVIRIGRAVVIGRVTAVTGSRQGRVVVVHVATGACHGRVRTRQRECGVVVIEAGIGPRGGAVAHVARGREADLRVVRIIGVVVIRLVAGDATGVRAGQLVIAVHVALLASDRKVEAGQCPARRRVIERATAPVGRRMALVASGWEAGLNVIRIGGAVVIVLVTVDAGAARKLVVVVDVALRALQRSMGAGQREAGGRVIERGIGPRRCAVTGLARRRKSGRGMRRVIRRVVVVLVATDAGGIRAGEVVIAVHVTLLALQSCMETG